MTAKETSRAAFDAAKIAYAQAAAKYAEIATPVTHENLLKAEKALASARKKAFMFWTSGDAPLL